MNTADRNGEPRPRIQSLAAPSRSVTPAQPGTAANNDAASISYESASEPIPDDCVFQPADWHVPGRYFRIWALSEDGSDSDTEIHKKTFILLDTKNTEGKGVLVNQYEKTEALEQLGRESDAKRKVMALRVSGDGDDMSDSKSHSTQRSGGEPSERARERLNKLTQILLKEDVPLPLPSDTYVLLDHTYNIPFRKYRCEDLGILERASLRILRLHYVNYLIDAWDLGEPIGGD